MSPLFLSVDIKTLIETLKEHLWGWGMLILILSAGVLLSIKTDFVQVFHFKKAFKLIFAKDDSNGEVSSFGALCTSLSATIGTGNIVGVATAVGLGGPGALFWMVVAAFFGMATKYAEGLLAVKYRQKDQGGHYSGGPFYYIEKGLGSRFRWLGVLFAIFGTLAGVLGIGTLTQSNGITSALERFFDPSKKHCIRLFGADYSLSVVIGSIVITICAAAVILGGIKRISAVSKIIVPFMAILYIGITVTILLFNISKLWSALQMIVSSAFMPSSVLGCTAGISVKAVMQAGIGRGIFSNEAGLGSAPIAAAAAKTSSPVRQGLVTMTGTFIDTVIICTLTGLTLVVTGAFESEAQGVQMTSLSWETGLGIDPRISSLLLTLCLTFFAFTTIIGWNYYSEKCLEYLFKKQRTKQISVAIFRVLYLLAVFLGPFIEAKTVWETADIFNALMALPNLVALLGLSGVVARETKEFFDGEKTVRKMGKK